MDDNFIYDGEDDLLKELRLPCVLGSLGDSLHDDFLGLPLLSDREQPSDDDTKSYQCSSSGQLSSSPSSSSSEGLEDFSALHHFKMDNNLDWGNIYSDFGLPHSTYKGIQEFQSETLPHQIFSHSGDNIKLEDVHYGIKQEVEMEGFSSRCSPSPQKHNNDVEYSRGLPQFKMERESVSPSDAAQKSSQTTKRQPTAHNDATILKSSVKILPDTPPVSPRSNLTPPDSPPIHNAVNGNQNLSFTLNGNSSMAYLKVAKNGLKVLPCQGGAARKIKIQAATPYAKVAAMPNGEQPKKTILLSAQDFAALSKKMSVGGSPSIVPAPSNSNSNRVSKIMDSPNITILPDALSATASTHTQMVSAPIALKRQPPLQAIASSVSLEMDTPGAAASAGHLPTDMAVRAMKKQQRMIKNRESACLSRKKKKEYVTLLEQRLAAAEAQILKLRKENAALRDRLSLPAPTKQDPQPIRLSPAPSGQSGATIRIGSAPLHSQAAPAAAMIGQRLSGVQIRAGSVRSVPVVSASASFVAAPTIKAVAGLFAGSLHKKNAALLFAMMFMVSLNIGGFGTYWLRGETAGLTARMGRVPHHTRTLLWDQEGTGSAEYGDNMADMSMGSGNTSRGAVCPPGGPNSTESARLAMELSQWISGQQYHNLTLTRPATSFNMDSFEDLSETRIKQLYGLGDNMLPVADGDHPADIKSDKLSGSPPATLLSPSRKRRRRDTLSPSELSSLELSGFKRQPDTFYLVALGGERLMLPASQHNHTLPPKMALVLPHKHYNESMPGEYVTLLQVDCAVLDTTVLRLRADSLPRYLTEEDFQLQPETETKKTMQKTNQISKIYNASKNTFNKSSIDANQKLDKFFLRKLKKLQNLKRNLTGPLDLEFLKRNDTKIETQNRNDDFTFFYKNGLKSGETVDPKGFNFGKLRVWRGNASYMPNGANKNTRDIVASGDDVFSNMLRQNKRMPGSK